MSAALDIALIQTRTPATQAAAWAELEPLVREAARGGARFILTPEASNVMEQRRERRGEVIVSEGDDAVVEGLRGLAQELGVWILIGSAIVKAEGGDGRSANRSLLVDDRGEIVARYDKLHVFDVDLPNGETYRESANVRPGERAAVAATPWGGLGLTVCYDLRFPHLFRQLAKAGAAMIAVPAAFTRPTGEAHWETLLRARAIETGAFVLAPAQGGRHEDGRGTWGRSTVVGPWGEIIAKADHDEPCVVGASLDMSAVARARLAIPALTHDRDFAPPDPLTP